ncbi:MAG: hypothetical protein GTO40_11195 [Deltaproteobacteria bacterium]|nr:hypothetical protein [Deltaproteobacteria bacterium]
MRTRRSSSPHLIFFFASTWFLLAHIFCAAVSPSEFTPPPGEAIRPLGEWEGHRRLVMVLSADYSDSSIGAQGQSAVRKAYLDLIKAVLPLVNVTVIVPAAEEVLSFAHWVDAEGLQDHLRDRRLVLETFEVNSIWIRDYGVLLARGEATGALYGIDPVYAQHAATESRFYDDRMAYWLFRQKEIRWVRSPLYLDGGNFDTDGQGTCFTSSETLGYNQTGLEETRKLFQAWIGCRETHILDPIPVESTGHIDMFFKVLSPDVWLLGQYAPRKNLAEPLDYLERLAHFAMEKNARTLQAIIKKRGRGRLIRINMPRPHTFDHYDLRSAERDSSDNPRRLVSTSGNAVYGKSEVGFASYVNSVYVRGERGEVVVIPSYSTDENDVKAVATFREAYPSAKIIRMPADYLIQDNGAVHCILYTMPD